MIVFVPVWKGGVDFASRVQAMEYLSLKTVPHTSLHPNHPSNSKLCYKGAHKKLSLQPAVCTFLPLIIFIYIYIYLFFFFSCCTVYRILYLLAHMNFFLNWAEIVLDSWTKTVPILAIWIVAIELEFIQNQRQEQRGIS